MAGEKRNPQPHSMRDGNYLIGWGMATATYPTNRSPASAIAQIMADGTAVVQSGYITILVRVLILS